MLGQRVYCHVRKRQHSASNSFRGVFRHVSWSSEKSPTQFSSSFSMIILVFLLRVDAADTWYINTEQLTCGASFIEDLFREGGWLRFLKGTSYFHLFCILK